MSQYATSPGTERELLPIEWVPKGYQKKGIKFLLQGGLGLFLDPGMGKTSVVLASILILIRKGIIGKSLVIAPLRVCQSVWPVEARSWKNFKELRVGVLHGKDKEKVLEEDLDIYVINPEGLSWLFGCLGRKAFFDLLVVDESTAFKHTNTMRFKLLKPHLPKFKIRWVLTGSPTSNGYLDLFGQCYIADMGESLGKYVTHYRKKYFVEKVKPGQMYPKYVLGESKEKEIHDLLVGKYLRLSAEDYLELPEIIVNDIRIDLPQSARKLYDDMEELMISEWNGSVITAMNAGSSYNKCRQIASGGLYKVSDDWEPGAKQKLVGMEIHNEKTKVLEEIVSEASGVPILVAFWYKHSRDRIRKLLGKNIPSIDGDCSDSEFMKIERDWNNGEIPILLGHPQSMAHGLNLQHSGNIVVWYDIIPDYERYLQFNRRIIRQGSTNKWVFVHRLIANKTVDLINISYLSRKSSSQEGFFEAMEEYLQFVKCV